MDIITIYGQVTRELIDETDYRRTHEETLRRAHQTSPSPPKEPPEDPDRQHRWPQNVKALQGPGSLEGDARGGGHSPVATSAARPPPKNEEPLPTATAGGGRRGYKIYQGKRIAL